MKTDTIKQILLITLIFIKGSEYVKKRYLLISLLLVVFIAAFTGCGVSKNGNVVPSPTSTSTTEKNTVIIQNFSFQPAELTIQKGESVTWINQDSADHTVTGTSFDSGSLSNGKVFKQTFNETGTFDYHCTYHPSMKGKVIVK